jgi:hypothetical protein
MVGLGALNTGDEMRQREPWHMYQDQIMVFVRRGGELSRRRIFDVGITRCGIIGPWGAIVDVKNEIKSSSNQ